MSEQKLTTEDFYVQVAEKLRSERKKAKMDQGMFANYLGLSRTTLINIEKCRQRISLEQAWLAADILRISINELLPPHSADTHKSWQQNVEQNEQIDDLDKAFVMSFINKALNNKK